jgi:methionyl-tRNA formyltransferase
VRVVVLGYHNVGVACPDVLVRAADDVVAAYTHRDDPTEEIWVDSIAERATRYGIPVRHPARTNHRRRIDRIRLDAPDVICSFYLMNMHGSHLPAYRGRCR